MCAKCRSSAPGSSRTTPSPSHPFRTGPFSASARTAIAGTPGSTLALLRGGTDIPAPQLTRQVEPGYPSIAQRARVQGNVILDVTIAPAGRVTNVQILRSIPLLDQAAIEAVKQWEFAPTVVNGVAMPVIMTVTVSFTLR